MSMTYAESDSLPDLGIRRIATLGAIGLFLLVCVLGGWAVTTKIGGAVVAGGQVIVHGKAKVVQSLDGGQVAEILVADGDTVTEGQLLLRLDPTLLKVNLDIARTRLVAALAAQARLRAEQLGQDAPVWEFPELPFSLPDATEYVAREHRLFQTRAEMLRGQRAQLAEALAQFESQSAGIRGQIAAIQDQARFLDQDLENLRKLAADGLARQSEMSRAERDRSALSGQLFSLEADLARIASARRDSELQTLQAERAFSEEVAVELREVTAKVEELTLEIVTRSAQLDRTDIRAPVGGIVHEMQASTVGGVVPPGTTILEVIPVDQGMDFELQVDPRAIDQVYPGQSAQIVLSSFDPQTTPKLTGEVTAVSANAIQDTRTGQEFYRINLKVPASEIGTMGDLALVPGMPVEAFLKTGDRSVLTYLIHPITSHLRRAFRE